MAGEIARWFVTLGVQGGDDVKRTLGGLKGDLSGLSKAVGVLKGALGTLGVAMAARTAYGFAEAGARALELQYAFQEVTRQAGISGDALLASLRRASGGTIAEMDLMLAANQAFMLGVGASLEDLTALMEVARFRARAMGLDTTQAFSDIIRGLGRMSPLILDNLGLVFDSEQEFKKYAESLGKAASELTAMEKRQALLQATLRVGKEQIAAAGGVARSSADDFREVAAALSDVKVAFQEMAAEIGVTKFLADAARGLAENVRGGREALASYKAFLAEVERLANAQAITAEEAQRFRDQYALLQVQLEYGAITQEQYANGVLALQKALEDTGEAFAKTTESARAWQDFLDAMPARLARAEEEQIAFAQRLRTGLRWADLPHQEGPVSPQWARILNKMWDDAAEQAKRAAEEARTAWQNTLDGIRFTLQGIMRPTFTFDYASVMDQLGHHIETWDEEARRAMDVVTRGLESPWAQRMLDLGMITQADIEAHAGDIRAAAATWIKEFYAGLHPEAIQAEPVAELWREQMTSETRWKGIFGELSQVLGKQLETDRGRMEAAGAAAGRVVAQGVKRALAEGDFLNYLVELIVPRLPSHAVNAAIRGGYIE